MNDSPSTKLPSYALIRNITQQDNAEALTELIRGGLSVDTAYDVNQYSLAHIAILDDAPNCLAALLAHGASPEQPNRYGVTVTECAVTEGRVGMVHRLAAAGANMKHADSGGTYLHSAALPTQPLHRAMEVVDRLLAEGVDINKPDREGTLPKNRAAQQSYEFGCQFMFRHDLHDTIASRSMSREELEKPRKRPGLEEKYHQRFMDMPVTWAWMGKIAPQLEKKGEHITREELTENPQRLAWALIGGAIPALDAHLATQGEPPIGMKDFVTATGRANPALEAVVGLHGEKRLFQQPWVKELSPRSQLTLMQALPKEAKQRMPDYHQRISRLQSGMSIENGRGRA